MKTTKPPPATSAASATSTTALPGEQVRLLGNVHSAGATVAGPTIPDPPPEPPAPSPPLFGRTQIMGHLAGRTLAPENTLAAVTKGFEPASISSRSTSTSPPTVTPSSFTTTRSTAPPTAPAPSPISRWPK